MPTRPDGGRRILLVSENVSPTNAFEESPEDELRRLFPADGEMADLLIFDVGMPGEDGCQLIRSVRESAGHSRDVPAIALTAYAHSTDRKRALRAGFQTHLTKPVEPGDLLTVVATLGHKISPT